MTQRKKFWIITTLFLVILLFIGFYMVFLNQLNQQKDIEYKFISISADKNHYYVVFMDTKGELKLIRTNDSLYTLNISVSNTSNVIWHHNKCTNYWCGSYDVYITNYSLLKR